MSDDVTPSPPTPEPRPGDGHDAGADGVPDTDGGLTGLDRLLPEVDHDAASAVFARSRSRRYRQRRTVQLVGAAAAVLVVGLLAVSLTGGDPEPDDLVTAGPDDGGADPTDPTDPTDPEQWSWEEPYEGEPSEITVADHGVEMTLSAAPVARVGDRLDVSVTITNVSDEPIGLGSGSACDPGASVGLRPVDSDVPAGTEHHGAQGVFGEGWDGDLSALADRLGGQVGPRNLAGRGPDDLWVRFPGCTMQLVPPEVLEPGDSTLVELVVEIRWGIDDVPEQMELVATSSHIGPTGEAHETGVLEGPQVTAVLPMSLVDDPSRAGSVDEVLGPDGVVAAPGLADWIDLSTPDDSWNVAPGTTIEQTWQTDLHWWDGLWVLWIDPDYLDGNLTGPLRVQYDPERDEVVDVRTVASGNGASADDPGAPEGYPPDVIIHRAD